MSTPLTNNTERIRELIQQIENLPNAGSGGIDLPTLDNPGAAEHLLQDKELINEVGVKVVGTMPNNGEVSRTMDGVNTKSVSIPDGYTSGGTVSLDNTIDNAVSDALAALAEKGVTVPAGTKVDGLADLIAAIQAGGGAKVELSELTPAADVLATAPLTVNHTLGVVPDFVCVFAKTPPASKTDGIVVGVTLLKPRFVPGNKNTLNFATCFRATTYSVGNGLVTTSSDNIASFLSARASLVSDMTETTLTLAGICNTPYAKLIAGDSYFLIVGAIVDE